MVVVYGWWSPNKVSVVVSSVFIQIPCLLPTMFCLGGGDDCRDAPECDNQCADFYCPPCFVMHVSSHIPQAPSIAFGR